MYVGFFFIGICLPTAEQKPIFFLHTSAISHPPDSIFGQFSSNMCYTWVNDLEVKSTKYLKLSKLVSSQIPLLEKKHKTLTRLDKWWIAAFFPVKKMELVNAVGFDLSDSYNSLPILIITFTSSSQAG